MECIILEVDEKAVGNVNGEINRLRGLIVSLDRVDSGLMKITAEIPEECKSDLEEFLAKLEVPKDTENYCSFCGRAESEVKKLVSSPGNDNFICNFCVVESVKIVSE